MNHVHQKKYNIGVLTPPIEASGIPPLSNLIAILENISNDLHIVTGGAGFDYFKNSDRINIYANNLSSGTTTFTRIVNFIFFQICESRRILELSNKIDCWFFFFFAEFQLFPTIMARLCRKKVIIIITGSSIKTLESKRDPLRYGLIILQYITCTLADKIVIYSDRLISDYLLYRWTRKIVVARKHFIDFENFKIKKDYNSRECIVGYVGRFSEEKGILQILQAVPGIVNKKPDVKFLFIGDGSLRQQIDQYILDNHLMNKIILPGWISHELLPDYLNQMKLLVIPSDTEGLPNIMLEAMACGTPVLATPVGAIPTIIKNEETGYIMENNSPQCIIANIIKTLNNQNIKKVIERGQNVIKTEFTFGIAVQRFSTIVSE